MREEDCLDNKFMMTIKKILNENFDLTKKFMIEKNAKLDMVHKMKVRTAQAPVVATKGAKTQNKNKKSPEQPKEAGKADVLDQKNVKYETSIDNADPQEDDEDVDDNLMGIDLDEDDNQAEEEEGDQDNKPISAE